MGGRAAVRYAVVDAFTSTPFKGNPGAVCLLEDGDLEGRDDAWMQSVAKEFNISETAFLIPSKPSDEGSVPNGDITPRFQLRWFTPVAEVKLCGHGTLAAAHFLFDSGSIAGEAVEFITKSGILTAKKICGTKLPDAPEEHSNGGAERGFSIELDFPVVGLAECDPAEVPSIPMTLGGASVVSVKKTAADDLLLELASAKEVAAIQPHTDEIRKCAGRGVIMTGPASHGSGFNFFTRFFCPKMGIDEDPVCGSAHCVLAPFWKEKLGKSNLIAYMASPRTGVLDLVLEDNSQRVKIRGEAVTVMEGSILA